MMLLFISIQDEICLKYSTTKPTQTFEDFKKKLQLIFPNTVDDYHVKKSHHQKTPAKGFS